MLSTLWQKANMLHLQPASDNKKVILQAQAVNVLKTVHFLAK